jgi:NodT family efflux transporter outer membrane factor (OMF) lipoprotein
MSAVPVARLALSAIVLALLGGCASSPSAPRPSQDAAAALPAQWYAPTPHHGELSDLAGWWAQFNDPLLDRLIADAQRVSPTVSTARLHIEQSRAARATADADRLPQIDASANVQRGVYDSRGVAAGSANGSITASWELDLFGSNAAAREGAQARFAGAQALWHDARISVAAEVATQYTALRACEAATAQWQLDADSRAETARLTGLTQRAGFDAPVRESLARAAAAQTHAQLLAQRTQCESIVKALVALTAQPEPALREALAASRGVIAQPREIAVPALPGALLQQRPDLASAEREVLAAAAHLTEVRIDRLPRIRLNGSVGATRYQGGGFGGIGGAGIPSIEGSGSTWSIGPLSVSMPIFDGGLRAAQVESARAGLTHAQTQYAATVRRAVGDVEQALVSLQGTAERQADAEIAATGYAESLRATDARWRGGLANRFDLEDARRASAQTQLAVIDLKRERVTAWISLYRALGGGWGATSPDAPSGDPVAAAAPTTVTARTAR